MWPRPQREWNAGIEGCSTTHPERPEIWTICLCTLSQEMSANGNSIPTSTPGLVCGLMARSLSLARWEEASTVSCSNCSNFPGGPILDSYSEATKEKTFSLLNTSLTNSLLCLYGAKNPGQNAEGWRRGALIASPLLTKVVCNLWVDSIKLV